MNKNEYKRPKSKTSFNVNKIMIGQKEKEIKNSLKNELFLSNKNKAYNKNNYLFKQQIFPKELKKSKEKNEKNVFSTSNKDCNNFNKNINSFSTKNKKNNPKIETTAKSLFTNSNLFFNSIDRKTNDINYIKNKEILPKLTSLKRLKSSKKINYSNNINNINIKENNKFYSTSNNFFKNKIEFKNIDKTENKFSNFNFTYNSPNNLINNNLVSSSLNVNNKSHSYYKKYTYIIRPENCGYLIKKCFNHRINWVELSDMTQNDFNFKWQQNTKNLNFSTLSKIGHFSQMVNHYEYHSVITNKANLFINLMKHAEWEEENVFKYIPFTVLFEYGSDNFFMMLEKFEYLFNNIEKFIVPFNEMDLSKYKYNKGRLYSSLFPYGEHLGNKTAINIPKTHFNDIKQNKNENDKNNYKNNLWLVKAPDLNRGMCIQVVDNINLIKKHINNYYRGIQRGYNREDGKERLLSPINSLLRNKTSKNVYKLDNINTNLNSMKYSDISSKNKDSYEFNTEQAYHQYRSNIIVIQKYIEKPLLYFERKFDIRIWVLLTHDFKVYMFNEGHLKCCSVKYNLNTNDNFSHLTNYSFQKYNNNFGKYEKGNEVSFDDLQYNIKVNYNNCVDFKNDIMPKIKKIIKFVFQSVKNKINGLNRNYTFEIYGFDFMLDNKFNPFLIEVNLNPGLEESSPLIKMLVPRMLDDALRLTVDKEFNTVYIFKGVEKKPKDKNFIYESPFPVNGYSNNENMFRFICDLNLEEGTNKKILKYRHLRINTKNFKQLHPLV